VTRLKGTISSTEGKKKSAVWDEASSPGKDFRPCGGTLLPIEKKEEKEEKGSRSKRKGESVGRSLTYGRGLNIYLSIKGKKKERA